MPNIKPFLKVQSHKKEPNRPENHLKSGKTACINHLNIESGL